MQKSVQRVRICQSRLDQWIKDNDLVVKEEKAIAYGTNIYLENGAILSVYRRASDVGINSVATTVLAGQYTEELARSFRQLCSAQVLGSVAAAERFDDRW